MECCICYEIINNIGFLCYKCVDGNICDLCYYNFYLEKYELIITEEEMYKIISCPVCRVLFKEIYVEN